MKIVVTDGYVSIARNLYRAGVEVDLDDATAESLIVKGVVAPVFGADSVENEANDEGEERIPGEDGMEPAELPSVDPAVAAKRTRDRKK